MNEVGVWTKVVIVGVEIEAEVVMVGQCLRCRCELWGDVGWGLWYCGGARNGDV